jgi:Fe(3+) dicitrate transport protein
VTQGMEIFAEYYFPIRTVTLSVFTSTSWMNARYREASVRVGETNVSVNNNKVESVPEWISRNGVNVKFQRASVSILYSYTAESYADALNTEIPSANGSVGKVPSYGLLDINSSWRISDHIMIRVNVNNVMDKQYYTKRPQFYPGPGIWSSDGRSVTCTLGFKI